MRSSPGRAVKGSYAPAASQEAWPDAEPWGRKSLWREPRVERRQASAPCKARAAPLGAEDKDQRLRRSASLFCAHDLVRKPDTTLGSSPRASFSGSCDARGAKLLGCLQTSDAERAARRIFYVHLSPLGRGRERSERVRGVRRCRFARSVPPHPPRTYGARLPLPTGEREMETSPHPAPLPARGRGAPYGM